MSTQRLVELFLDRKTSLPPYGCALGYEQITGVPAFSGVNAGTNAFTATTFLDSKKR